MFKSQAIILSIQRIRDNKSRIVVFTKEYGKISCWYKKKDICHDIGDIVTLCIDRYSGENHLKSIDANERLNSNIWQYGTIISFLEIIKIFYTLLPDSVPHTSIFEDYRGLVGNLRNGKIAHLSHYSLFQFRILKVLGFIDGSECAKDSRMNYIHENITLVPIKRILESKPLNIDEGIFIKRINYQALYRIS